MFHVGQEVVCVDDSPVEVLDKFDGGYVTRCSARPLVAGRIYTITGILAPSAKDYYRNIGNRCSAVVQLQEVVNPLDESGGFAAERFRPVQRKQLPESLTRLLDLPKDVEVA